MAAVQARSSSLFSPASLIAPVVMMTHDPTERDTRQPSWIESTNGSDDGREFPLFRVCVSSSGDDTISCRGVLILREWRLETWRGLPASWGRVPSLRSGFSMNLLGPWCLECRVSASGAFRPSPSFTRGFSGRHALCRAGWGAPAGRECAWAGGFGRERGVWVVGCVVGRGMREPRDRSFGAWLEVRIFHLRAAAPC